MRERGIRLGEWDTCDRGGNERIFLKALDLVLGRLLGSRRVE